MSFGMLSFLSNCERKERNRTFKSPEQFSMLAEGDNQIHPEDVLLGSGDESETPRRCRGVSSASFLVGGALLLWMGAAVLGHGMSSAPWKLKGTSGDRAPSGRMSEAEVQQSTPPKFWLMCPSDECIWFRKPGTDWIFKNYPANTWDVSQRIDDTLTKLDGIPQGMWNQVRQRWLNSPPMFKGRQVLLQAIVVNQRQLAYLVINALLGNKLQGIETGLDAALARCTDADYAPGADQVPDIVYSLLSYLAILSHELQGDQDGTFLVGGTPGPVSNAWLQELQAHSMIVPTMCNHESLKAGTCGLSDFMAAGTPNQALTDIAGMDVGGGAQLCNVANSQDESLVIFYPEVLAFSIFVGQKKMLPVPFTLLGARRYVNTIYGETGVGPPFNNLCGTVDKGKLLNEDILTQDMQTHVSLTPVTLKAAAFVAAASYCSDCHRGDCTEPDMFNNNCDSQRRHLDQDISAWLQAFNNANYHSAVVETFASVVHRIGTGPWGGGLWQGDCQQYFLAVWLATSMLNNMQLDYYVYDHFCENAGHQCFVLPKELCQTCIEKSGMSVVIDSSRCGDTGAQDLVDRMKGRKAEDVYYLLRDVGPPPTQVFDLMAGMV